MIRRAFGVAALALVSAAGCYTVGPLTPAGVFTVSLPMVENLTSRRDLEFDLTQALAIELQSRGMRLVSSGHADAACHVRITGVEERTLAEDARNQTLQGSITVIADVVLRERGGATLVDRRGIRETDNYLVRAGETEDRSTSRAARVLARRIANALESGF